VAWGIARRTGLSVKDTGLRDDFGMEDMDAFFPPPEKEPKANDSSLAATALQSTANMTVVESAGAAGADTVTEATMELIQCMQTSPRIKTTPLI
jgi:hypothetical protein